MRQTLNTFASMACLRERITLRTFVSIFSMIFCLFCLVACGGGGGGGDQAPSSPSNLVAGTIGESSVAMSWDAPNHSHDLVSGYKVYISDDNGSSYSVALETSATSRYCTVYDLSASTMYCFRVTAVGNGGAESSPSNVLAVTTYGITKEGVFVDSPVNPLNYETDTLAGATNASGTFKYREGETITFSVADIVLGQSVAKPMISPIDLVKGAVDETDRTVTNICRLLQSLDFDMDLDGGIQIGWPALEEIRGLPIDFTQSPEDFGNDQVIQSLFDALNSRSYFLGFMIGRLRTAEEAQIHLRATLTNWGKTVLPLESDLEVGFPVGCQPFSGTYRAGPVISNLVGDIDGDDYQEILVSALAAGPLYAFKHDGSFLTFFGEPVADGVAYPALGVLSPHSTGLDVAFGTFGVLYGPKATIELYDGAGTLLPGWPRQAANYVTAPPALADIDGDGIDEIFVEEQNWCLNAYKADGTVLPGWPFCAHFVPSAEQEFSTPAVEDIDNDGYPELIAASGSQMFILNHDGTLVDGFPVEFPASVHSFPVVGDVDGDNQYEIVVGGFNDFTYDDGGEAIIIIDNSGRIEYTIDLSFHDVHYGSAPALADLNGDGTPEIIYQTEAYLFVYTHNVDTFELMPGWPQRVSQLRNPWAGDSSPVVGDVDADGSQEIVITVHNVSSPSSAEQDDEVRVYESNGLLHPRFPKAGALGSGGTPAISDIDLDGRNEIIIRGGTFIYDPVILVYDLGGENHGKIEWGQFGRDCRHSSSYPK